MGPLLLRPVPCKGQCGETDKKDPKPRFITGCFKTRRFGPTIELRYQGGTINEAPTKSCLQLGWKETTPVTPDRTYPCGALFNQKHRRYDPIAILKKVWNLFSLKKLRETGILQMTAENAYIHTYIAAFSSAAIISNEKQNLCETQKIV